MRLDQWSDFSPEIDRDEIDVTGAEAFIASHSSFPQTEFNGSIMVAWCEARDVPCTNHNLTIAWAELKREGLLEIVQPVDTPPSRKNVDVVLPKDTAENLKALQKLKDDPLLSDTTRRKRDAALKKLAIASRITHRQGPSLRGGERIVI